MVRDRNRRGSTHPKKGHGCVTWQCLNDRQTKLGLQSSTTYRQKDHDQSTRRSEEREAMHACSLSFPRSLTFSYTHATQWDERTPWHSNVSFQCEIDQCLQRCQATWANGQGCSIFFLVTKCYWYCYISLGLYFVQFEIKILRKCSAYPYVPLCLIAELLLHDYESSTSTFG